MEGYALKHLIRKTVYLLSSEASRKIAKWKLNQALLCNIKVNITNLYRFISQTELMEASFTLATSLSSSSIKNK